ncbi:MAG TPA: hypothetical protein VHW68_00485 [Actinomycetota bacterium]|nr:hypothetical protein [Actinomycetota bacterium]
MPGRAFIGLSPSERHRAEFEPQPLPDEPEVTVWLVAGAVFVALLVIGVGFEFHLPATRSFPVHHGLCPSGTLPSPHGTACPRLDLSWWNQISMTVWFVYAALAAALVMITPFLVYRVKRKTGQV